MGLVVIRRRPSKDLVLGNEAAPLGRHKDDAYSNGSEGRLLSDFLASAWPAKEAKTLMDLLGGYVARDKSPDRPQPAFGPNFVVEAITAGEQRLLDWAPT